MVKRQLPCVLLASAAGLLCSCCELLLISKPWHSSQLPFHPLLPDPEAEPCAAARAGSAAMEQYTANSSSSTEQIVVQAGQIQQQVCQGLLGELLLPLLGPRSLSAAQSCAQPARCCVARPGWYLLGCLAGTSRPWAEQAAFEAELVSASLSLQNSAANTAGGSR